MGVSDEFWKKCGEGREREREGEKGREKGLGGVIK